MRSPNEIVFLFDVDNTLLDNDRVQDDLTNHLEREFGKFLGGLAAVLCGLDTVIFAGGTGENAPPIRRRISENMEFLGIHLDPIRNDANAPVISHDHSPTTVRVMKPNEELMIARHTYNLICEQRAEGKK
jgi:acetate kinase